MRCLLVVLSTVALLVGAVGCSVVDARQTLLHLEDGRTLFAEGRRDVCLRIEDPDGEVVDEDCQFEENPLGMAEYGLFATPGGTLLVGIAPVDVAEVAVDVDGRELEAELIESDLTTGFYLVELPADAQRATVVGRTAAGDPVDDPVPVELPR